MSSGDGGGRGIRLYIAESLCFKVCWEFALQQGRLPKPALSPCGLQPEPQGLLREPRVMHLPLYISLLFCAAWILPYDWASSRSTASTTKFAGSGMTGRDYGDENEWMHTIHRLPFVIC